MTEIQTKRVYLDPHGDDGFRILVDRLWPQGESHANFHYDLWAKDIAPSTELRQWFHADPEGRKAQFLEKYEAELEANPAMPAFIDTVRAHPLVTLLYASRDTAMNNAVVLQRYLRARL